MRQSARPDPASEPDRLVKTKLPQDIRSMFDTISPTYDFLNHLLSLGNDRRWRRCLAKRVLSAKHKRILDVCCGTGDVLLELQRQAALMSFSPTLVGTDFSFPMLHRAIGKARTLRASHGVTGFHWSRSDTMQLPFRDETFDLVTVAFGIRNLSDPPAGLKELWRVTCPMGQLAVLEFSKPTGFFLQKLYGLYFHSVVPALGHLISRSKAYVYLPKSVSEFPDGEDFCAALRNAGWKEPVAQPLSRGIVTLYLARK
ncbi:MAG: bifunctional demethylmenaquinone methyltransferase/2-methoxy-6-polyprenyl-1,4-benzoquinol methylase UbiE [Candidatus Sumerlaeaceae bacterium]|nr:bifunctional demethylmenaquinone methyltransferase/2-methoxy-6-polyprenyl-1,4-benzoquinol methylase UbiE [Candidatus Sumerlaeaceae bacterium]